MSRIGGQRLTRVRERDLPLVALGVTSYLRGKAKILHDSLRNVPYVRFVGPGVDLFVLESDWDKIKPLLKGDMSLPKMGLDRSIRYDVSGLDPDDRDLYSSTLHRLTLAFS